MRPVSGLNLDIVEAIDADGGHAAIRVTGLAALPPDPTFRIDPIDDALAEVIPIGRPARAVRRLSSQPTAASIWCSGRMCWKARCCHPAPL